MDEYFFDDTLPQKIKQFIATFCRLSKSPWNGQPLDLLPYQLDIIDGLYGWRKTSDSRLKHKVASIWLPKKNGKSSFCSAIALFNLLWKPGSDVAIVAPTIKQAGMVFDEACAMVDQHPTLKKRLWVRRNLKRVEDRKGFSTLQILSCSPEISGHNLSCLILDELAEFPKCHAQIVLDRLANATDARPDGHKLFISTAQFDLESPGFHCYQTTKQAMSGEIKRPDLFGMIFEVTPEQNWKLEENWLKANPACPKLFPVSTIREDFNNVEQSPIEEARFKTLRLSMWVGHTMQWLSSDKWAKCCDDDLREEDFHGEQAFIGIDFARRYDDAAYSILIPKGEDLYVFIRFFIPELFAAKKEKMKNVPYLRAWQYDPKCNLFLTPGDVVDPRFMRSILAEDCKNFNVTEVRFDQWGMEETRQILADEGLPMVDVKQSPTLMSPAYSHLERLVIQAKLHTPNNPILNWNAGNCCVRTIGATNQIMVDKQKSTASVDGIVSIAIGITAILAEQEFYTSSPIWM